MSRISVIGSGFAGLSVATELANAGHHVTIYEKNSTIGGRARQFKSDGFTFDMGPSWYWMPDVFEDYFKRYGKEVSDFYDLKRLDPSYQVYFGPDDFLKIPARLTEFKSMIESLEPGSAQKLDNFLREAQYKYNVGMKELAHSPGLSISEFVDARVLRSFLKLDMFSSIASHVRKYFSHPKILQLFEFPILFLGATPEKTPALYSLMNYADICLGTWYPKGGMHKIIEGMAKLAIEKGVEIVCNANVEQIIVENNTAKSLLVNGQNIDTDVVVAAADYHHVDQHLLEKEYQNYNNTYWENRDMAPSSIIYYLGVNKKLKNLQHHNLFFDQDFKQHAKEIYTAPEWPSNPLFYVCAPSITDKSVAPEGYENLFILIPTAPGLIDSDEIKERYLQVVLDRLERLTGQLIRNSIIYQRSYAASNFIEDYNAFNGNAYGLANTLRQTALLKPSIKNKKVQNLYYTGQLTVPGPGVPPSIISGQIVGKKILKSFKPTQHEEIV